MSESGSRYQLLLCNCPDSHTAQQLAQLLVDQRLAACVNCLPGVQSVYRWHDKVETANEVTLLIKTTATQYQAVETALSTAHPNEVPEVIAVDISAGLPAYLQWLEDSV